MQQGENWNALMTDAMVLQSCIEVTQNYVLTSPSSNSSTLIWAGTYLDTYDDAETLAQLPRSIKVHDTPVTGMHTCIPSNNASASLYAMHLPW